MSELLTVMQSGNCLIPPICGVMHFRINRGVKAKTNSGLPFLNWIVLGCLFILANLYFFILSCHNRENVFALGVSVDNCPFFFQFCKPGAKSACSILYRMSQKSNALRQYAVVFQTSQHPALRTEVWASFGIRILY